MQRMHFVGKREFSWAKKNASSDSFTVSLVKDVMTSFSPVHAVAFLLRQILTLVRCQKT